MKRIQIFLRHFYIVIFLFIISIFNIFFIFNIQDKICKISNIEKDIERELKKQNNLLQKLKLLDKIKERNSIEGFKNSIEAKASLLNYLNLIAKKHHARLIRCQLNPIVNQTNSMNRGPSLNPSSLNKTSKMGILMETRFTGYAYLQDFLNELFPPIKKQENDIIMSDKGKIGFWNINEMRIQKSGMNLLVFLKCIYYYHIEEQ